MVLTAEESAWWSLDKLLFCELLNFVCKSAFSLSDLNVHVYMKEGMEGSMEGSLELGQETYMYCMYMYVCTCICICKN